MNPLPLGEGRVREILVRLIVTTLSLAACLLVVSSASAEDSMLQNLERLQDYRALRHSSSQDELEKNGDSRPIEPGETLVLAEMEGPGEITHIWCTVASKDPFYGRSLVLRMYWEGTEQPSVEAPLGDFFGVGHGAMTTYTSLPAAVTSHGRARNCFWKMPFRASARITVTNESLEYRTDSFYYYVDWRQYDAAPEDLAYFHARYRQETPAEAGDYLLLETAGRGHYVGTVYSVHQMERGWFGEGDDRFYIDGEEYPSIRGTGTEDYFGDAWGFREFATPFYGVPLFDGYFEGDRVTAYRWHIPDPIPFTTSLRAAIEHKGSIYNDMLMHLGQHIERADWISSVAFWYQTPPAAASEPLPPIEQRTAPYRIVKPSELTARSVPDGLVQQSDGGVGILMNADGTASLEVDFAVEEAGRYQVNTVLSKSLLGGLYQPYVDGVAVGAPLNLQEVGEDPVWVPLDLHNLQPGTHTVRFEGKGTPPEKRLLLPPMNALQVYSVILLRMEDMAGYRQAMKAQTESRTQQ